MLKRVCLHLWLAMVGLLTAPKQESCTITRNWFDQPMWEDIFIPSMVFLSCSSDDSSGWTSSSIKRCEGCLLFSLWTLLLQASAVRICQWVKCKWTSSVSRADLGVSVLPGDQCVYRFNPFDLFVINLLWRMTTFSLLQFFFFFVKLCTVFIFLSCFVDP